MAGDFWTSLSSESLPASPFGNDASYTPFYETQQQYNQGPQAAGTEGYTTSSPTLSGYSRRMPNGRVELYDPAGKFMRYETGPNMAQKLSKYGPAVLAAIGGGYATGLLGGPTAAGAAGAGAAELGAAGGAGLETYGGAGLYGDAAAGSGLATASGTGLTAAEIAAATAGTGAAGVGNALASAAGPGAAGMTIAQMVMAGIPLASAVIMADATKDAATVQKDAVTQANNLQERMYNEQVARLAPYAAGGLTAQNQLMSVLGLGPNTGQPGYGKYAKDFSMADFQQDPGYAFRMSEGLKALDRTAASRGGLMSGATLKGTQRYGQDLASQEYSNAFNRYQTNRTNQLQPLGNLMAAGQSAAGGQNTASGSYGTSGSELAQAQGNIAAQQGINTANAYTGALQSGISSYQNQNLMNQLLAYNSKP